MASINRSQNTKFLALFVTMQVFLLGCATGPSKSDQAFYFESSYNDHNRAPSSFAPAQATAFDEKKGERIDPVYMQTQADYYFSTGESYSLDGKHEKAIEAFRMVQIYDATSAQVCLRLAAEYVKMGLLTEALEQAQSAVKKNAKYIDAHILLGGLYSTLKQYPKAIEEYESVLKIQPENTEAPLYLGALYAEQKQHDRSIKYFEALAKNDEYPTPYAAYYYIGRVRMDQDTVASRKAAEVAFKKALSIKPNHVESVLALGGLYTKAKQEDKTLQLYKTFQKEQGPNSRVAEILSQIYLGKEDYDLAYEQLELMEEGDEDSLNIKVKMALIMIEKKKYDIAIKKLYEVLKQVPESDKIQFYLAAIHEEIGEKAKAVEHFTKILPQSSFYAESIVHATYLLKSLGQVDKAAAVAKSAYQARPDLSQVYAVYASLLDEKKDYQTAAAVLKSGLEKFPDQVQLWFFMGTIQDRLGKRDLVVDHMKKVIEMDPNHVQGLNYLAFTYAESGKNLGEAEKLVRRALELEPHDGYILDTMGWVLFKKGSYAESIRYLEAAAQRQPNESIIADHLGDAYLKSELPDKAKSMYQRAAELETEIPKVNEIRAKISSIEKQEKRANRIPASTGN